MPEWLKDLLAFLGLIFPGVFSCLFAWISSRNTKAISIRDATIKSLETSLAAERVSLAHHVSNAERHRIDKDEIQRELNLREERIHALQDKISELEEKLKKRPSPYEGIGKPKTWHDRFNE